VTQTTTLSSTHRTRSRDRIRTTAALAAATALFALIPVLGLPMLFLVPVFGLLLAAGTRPDHVPDARPIANTRSNAVLGVLISLAAAVVILRPQLTRPLYTLFGPDLSELLLDLLAVAVLAVPLLMRESSLRVDGDPGAERIVLTRRNLTLSLTLLMTVTVWYAERGLSFVPIAALVLGLPLLLGLSRLAAARRGRLELALWRHPLAPGLRWHRLQLANVLSLCLLLVLAERAGTYAPAALDLSPAGQHAFTVGLYGGLIAFALLATVPLRRVRLGSNLLVLAGSVFVAAQLVAIYRPAVDPLTIASPLAAEWFVGQGGHAELVNYHQVTSTQADALDILQAVDGRTHRPGSTELTSYYIYGQPVLAPADGVVTGVQNGQPDQQIGTTNAHYQEGNAIVLDVGDGRYLMMAHLKPDSITVRVGDQVRAGQPIARVGNSGNTTEPHLHLQAQTLPTDVGDVQAADISTLLRTLHTYPVVFRDVVLTRGGSQTRPTAADVRRGDYVRPADPA
jgi:hypothetical protein